MLIILFQLYVLIFFVVGKSSFFYIITTIITAINIPFPLIFLIRNTLYNHHSLLYDTILQDSLCYCKLDLLLAMKSLTQVLHLLNFLSNWKINETTTYAGHKKGRKTNNPKNNPNNQTNKKGWEEGRNRGGSS